MPHTHIIPHTENSHEQSGLATTNNAQMFSWVSQARYWVKWLFQGFTAALARQTEVRAQSFWLIQGFVYDVQLPGGIHWGPHSNLEGGKRIEKTVTTLCHVHGVFTLKFVTQKPQSLWARDSVSSSIITAVSLRRGGRWCTYMWRLSVPQFTSFRTGVMSSLWLYR